MAKDAIVLLKEDHKLMRKLFRQFEKAGEDAHATKDKVARQILEELTVHTYLENECMYPEVRRLLPDLEDDILESYEEHHVADLLVLELVAMDASHERFAPKMTVLIENVEHHMGEEEDDWFPKVREGLGRKQLGELGDRMLAMKKKAPRSPLAPKAMKKTVDAAIA
ncbi:MAG: hemerythrin domain-containing protein [Sporichthyaceae bacterium]